MATEKLQFEASAYLQTLIGRDLIRAKETAIVELVKNSYDSGASSVIVRLTNETKRRPASIEIIDNGSGMDLRNLRSVFMVAGYSEKSNASHSSRVPTGEKGIGRFASDRLGRRLLVETKTAKSRIGLVVNIDWAIFSNRKKRFSDITVPLSRRPIPEFAPEDSGTRLTISSLREPWDRSSVESLRLVLAQLLDPFEPPGNFEVDLQVTDSPALSGPIDSAAPEGPDVDIRFSLDAKGNLERSIRSPTQPPSTSRLRLGESSLAGLKGRFLYYHKRPSKSLVGGRLPGVSIYRDGFRVEPFGSGNADWLGIGEHRAKRAGHAHIVPSRLFGFVSISRIAHAQLKDTTSREALLDTIQSRALVHLLRSAVVAHLEEYLREQVSVPRWEQNTAKKASQLQEVRYQALSVMASGVAHELRQPLQSIRVDAGNIRAMLQQLGVQDGRIDAAQQSIDLSIERIDQRIKLIFTLTGKALDDIKRVNLSKVIREECSEFLPRARSEAIELKMPGLDEVQGDVSEELLRMVTQNLVDNALNAHSRLSDRRAKRIDVGITHHKGGHALSVKDNASGIPTDIQDRLLTKFATHTTGGMGVGLYICRLLLESHGGSIDFETKSDVGTVFSVTLVDEEDHSG